MDERARRIGLNEAVFREVNERIGEIAQSLGNGKQALDLLCECGDATCAQRITMSRGEYEQLRSEGARFAVVPGHVVPDVERVVEAHRSYEVVQKNPGGPAELAEEKDPRS